MKVKKEVSIVNEQIKARFYCPDCDVTGVQEGSKAQHPHPAIYRAFTGEEGEHGRVAFWEGVTKLLKTSY